MKAAPVDAIAGTRVFEDLPSSVLERLAAASEPMSLSPNELLLGGVRAAAHDVYVVAEGRIRVFREGNPAGDVTLGEDLETGRQAGAQLSL